MIKGGAAGTTTTCPLVWLSSMKATTLTSHHCVAQEFERKGDRAEDIVEEDGKKLLWFFTLLSSIFWGCFGAGEGGVLRWWWVRLWECGQGAGGRAGTWHLCQIPGQPAAVQVSLDLSRPIGFAALSWVGEKVSPFPAVMQHKVPNLPVPVQVNIL